LNPHAAATPDDAEMSTVSGCEPFLSSKTSLPLTAKSGLIETSKRSALGALSSTRAIKLRIAFVEDEVTGGFGHRMTLSIAEDSMNIEMKKAFLSLQKGFCLYLPVT
jgi:hypothetical protein